jgi:hydroxymethylbilane synthase
MAEIIVGARASPLSQAQVEEVASVLPQVSFHPLFVESTGDLDQKTSLRTLDKTDFFTKEIDAMLLSGACRIAIHSAKDLPEPLPQGLTMVALTRGVDPSDSLVIQENSSLKKNPLIATSSLKRESAVSAILPQARFCDIRGTIGKRLEKLSSGEIDGVVIAEAALIRLKLTHLNRIKLPGVSTPYQGQLAILARTGDQEMVDLFASLDVRSLPKALYFGPDLPSHEFRDRWLHHYPLIRIEKLPPNPEAYKQWGKASHVIFTSKNTVKTTLNHLKELNIPAESLKEKTVLAIGQATSAIIPFYKELIIAKTETQEGIIELLSPRAYYFYPHSALSRPLLDQALSLHPHVSFAAYTISQDPLTPIPDLHSYPEAIFSSPSTVEAFFTRNPKVPDSLRLTAIGPVTQAALKQRLN